MKLIRFLLFPFAIIYSIITTIRNYFFDIGLFKSTSFKKPIIAVGNLSVGGTGKTPQIEYLIQLLRDNYKIGVLSRGYGRKTKGFILVDDTKNAVDVGDEPLQFSKKFKEIAVAVDENRVNGIQQMQSSEVILLDDAFQHRKVKAGFYVLLTKYNELFSNDFVLPTGNLRERRIGAKRTDVLVVTKCPATIDTLEKKELKQLISRYFNGPIFFSTIQYADVLFSNNDVQIKTSDLNLYEVLLVTGIANPKPLESYLSSLNCAFKHVKFPDHHQFSEEEIADLKEQFIALKSKNKIILTTEKDFVRLFNQLENLYYLPIQTQFLEGQEKFNLLITDYIKESL
ncbi:tetraacyldisaccharide 4'-kinase [Polaribacter uvawellassae]|uniref:tetraacyldisaccharide 4'-kinase n=1 Tax=Polaribacter uvawellassae TaxID=3133495 RepID=UPI003219387C